MSYYIMNNLNTNLNLGCNGRNNKIAFNRGNNAMPRKFYPTVQGNFFAMNRNAFIKNSNGSKNYKALPRYILKQSYNKNKNLTGKPIQSSQSYSSSSYTASKRMNAAGYNTKSQKYLAFDKQNYNTVNSALNRVRNKGYVVPKKTQYYF